MLSIMRRLILVLIILCMAAPASAQYLPKGKLMVFLGAAYPTNPSEFGDYSNAGFGGGVAVGAMVSPMFYAGANIAFTRFDSNLIGVGDMNNTYIALEMRIYLIPSPQLRVRPYIPLGVGFYYNSFADTKVTNSESRSAFGYSIGLGAEVRIVDTSTVYAELDYVSALQTYEVDTLLGTEQWKNPGYLTLRIGIAVGLGVF